MNYPGVIKAFHYHEKQDDLWFFPSGNAQVVLYDLRKDSPTKGETNVHYMGEESDYATNSKGGSTWVSGNEV